MNNTSFIKKHTSETYRKEIKLPQMLSEDKLNNLPVIRMPKGEIIENRLKFVSSNHFTEALRLGFFLVKIPDDFDLTPGDLFVRNFFKHKSDHPDLDIFRGFKNIKIEDSYQGYFDREFDQWENFYIESANWERYFPSALKYLGHQMADLGICVLKSVFEYLQIPNHLWLRVTSGLSEKKGHQMLAFNHFRSDKPVRGSKFHRDSGWVTVLRSFDPGLVAFIEDTLYAINPKDGYFIVNFGSSIEVLTEKLNTPVRGNIHGVVRTIRTDEREDRTSYAMFLDSNLTGNIYQLENVDQPRMIQTVTEFAIQEVSRTYDNDNIAL